MQKKEIRFEFFASKTGRLDVLLSEFCVDFSRSNVAGAIKNNLVLVNEKIENKPSKNIKIDDKITLLKAFNEISENSNILENSNFLF